MRRWRRCADGTARDAWWCSDTEHTFEGSRDRPPAPVVASPARMSIAPNDFTHLHVHSEFSLLDGLGRIDDMVGQASALGFDSLAITDHGALYGAVAFYQACMAKEIK